MAKNKSKKSISNEDSSVGCLSIDLTACEGFKDLEKRVEEVEKENKNLSGKINFLLKQSGFQEDIKPTPKYKIGDKVIFSVRNELTGSILGKEWKGTIKYFNCEFYSIENEGILYAIKEEDIFGYADCIPQPNPKYKIGDYVEFYDRDGLKQQGKIINIFCDGTYDIKDDNYGYYIKESKIIGYAKPDLLTPEEKAYLSAVIKPFGRDLSIIRLGTGDLEIDNNDRVLIIIDGTFMFKKLKAWENYTLEDLGLNEG